MDSDPRLCKFIDSNIRNTAVKAHDLCLIDGCSGNRTVDLDPILFFHRCIRVRK